MSKIIVICGATASGKTRLAVDLAKYLDTEVISADSMQVYRRMDIGTAKPTAEEMQGITHHLIDIIEPTEHFDLSRFVELAGTAAAHIYGKGKIPIMAGGTGLYTDTFISNISLGEMKSLPEYRTELEKRAETQGGEMLLKELALVDSATAGRLHPNDVRRIIRALEIYKSTGIPQSRHIEESRRAKPLYDALYLGLNYGDRDVLYDRIDRRVDAMMEAGLVGEVEALLDEGVSRNCTSMQAIGYKEVCDYLSGKYSLEQTVDTVKQSSRRYAKRQLTWLRRNQDIRWLAADGNDYSDILEICKKHIEIFMKI